MFDTNKRAFVEILQGTMETYHRPISPAALGIWWHALASYDLETVRAAFHRHLTDPDQGRFPPTPAAIIGQMPDAVAVMDADEAWGLVTASLDERNTVVLTDLMLEASAGCGEVWEYDKVGARMMFKSAYERLTAQARMTGRQPVWRVSLGWDEATRISAIQQGVDMGRLTHDQASQYLPAPVITPQARAIAGLLTGQVVELPQDDATRERLAALRASLKRHADCPSLSQIRKAQIEAKKYEALAVTELRR